MKKLFEETRSLPVSVRTKKEVVFVLSSVVAIAKGKNVIAQLCAMEQGGMDQILGLANDFWRILPHASEPVGHVDCNHGCVMESFLQ